MFCVQLFSCRCRPLRHHLLWGPISAIPHSEGHPDTDVYNQRHFLQEEAQNAHNRGGKSTLTTVIDLSDWRLKGIVGHWENHVSPKRCLSNSEKQLCLRSNTRHYSMMVDVLNRWNSFECKGVFQSLLINVIINENILIKPWFDVFHTGGIRGIVLLLVLLVIFMLILFVFAEQY